MANGVEFGLASSVWTADHGRALRCALAFDFGCVRPYGQSKAPPSRLGPAFPPWPRLPALAPPSRLGPAELGSCASSGRTWRLRAARDTQGERLGHWAPSHCLRCSCQPPPKPPIPPPLTVQVWINAHIPFVSEMPHGGFKQTTHTLTPTLPRTLTPILPRALPRALPRT